MATAKRLSNLQQLQHRVRELERLVKKHDLKPITIENFINLFSTEHGKPAYSGKPVSAPIIVEVAKKHGIKFKPTSVSAYLCKMVRWGLARKYERHQTFHTYLVK